MTKKISDQRRTLFEYIEEAQTKAVKNKYCERTALVDEASVELFFVSRLINDLGYKDKEIKPKESLDELTIAKGRKKEKYRPDYAIVCDGKTRWLIEAKGPEEKVDKWAYQGAGYAFAVNRQYTDENPVQYFMITNGFDTKIWKWDESESIISLKFSDFFEESTSYLTLRALLEATNVRKGWEAVAPRVDTIILKKPTVEEVKRIFKNCHDLIWKSEKMNPQPAFFEFVKMMFVKLWEDRKLHEDLKLGNLLREEKPIPRSQLTFCTQWIDSLESRGVGNPVDEVLFRHLTETINEAVAKGKKKPIFEFDEKIRLHSGTIRQVVLRLERYDMFGIDEDLNGRLFETFLSATMRGESLGQYFTPRSIVKLMEKLASPVAGRDRTDTVLDACCGTGGFLIETLTDMRSQVRSNTSLSVEERKVIQERIANESLFGIDAGQDPPLARIARINMYLHGDGGSRIYAADSLDKTVTVSVDEDAQSKIELEELRNIITEELKSGFDIVLTNPPFSMGYSATLPNEEIILKQYELTTFGFEGTSKRRTSLSSRIMFLERYADLLKPGGKLITVIDDSTLSTKKYTFAREFIRNKFIVRGVISLPGDAFQRVGARAKTSVLYLIKRQDGETGQPDVFMWESSQIGLDDVTAKTPRSRAELARIKAEEEISEILDSFKRFMRGEKGKYLVPASSIQDRLDVKSCLPRSEDIVELWKENGLSVIPLGEIVNNITEEVINPKLKPQDVFTFLRVRYDGLAEEGETRLGNEVTYSRVQHPQEDDLVVSNIAMPLGAVCVLPERLRHTIASSEFTIMRIKDKRFKPWFLWGYLRSAEIRARLLSKSTGISRHRVTWDFLREIPVPLVDIELQRKVSKLYRESVEHISNAEEKKTIGDKYLNGNLGLNNEWAIKRLKAAKPPK